MIRNLYQRTAQNSTQKKGGMIGNLERKSTHSREKPQMSQQILTKMSMYIKIQDELNPNPSSVFELNFSESNTHWN